MRFYGLDGRKGLRVLGFQDECGGSAVGEKSPSVSQNNSAFALLKGESTSRRAAAVQGF